MELNLQWQNRLGTMEIVFCHWYFQPARVSFYIYRLNARDTSPIYGVSLVRVFVMLFSFSVFSDRRSLKTENEKKINAEV